MTQAQSAPWQVALEQHAPTLLKDVTAVRENVMADGALPGKVKILMSMLCDAILAHPDGVANIAQRARAAGASDDEIAETIGVAFVMGGMPGLVTGANAFRS